MPRTIFNCFGSNVLSHSTFSDEERYECNVRKSDSQHQSPMAQAAARRPLNFQELDIKSLIVGAPELGSGCHGCVYEVEWKDNPYAAKVYRTESQGFQREIMALGTMTGTHPNIIQLVAVDFALQAILMEKCDMNLDEALRKKDFPYYDFLKFGLHIACGMARMHALTITHGDLKPLNVLLSRRLVETKGESHDVCEDVWTAKIADYGLAKLQGSSSAVVVAHTYLREPDFVSGKVAGDYEAYKGADVYAAGWMYLEMMNPALELTDWRNKYRHELISKPLDEKLLEKVEKQSKDAAFLIDRCWKKAVQFSEQELVLNEIILKTDSHQGENFREFLKRRGTSKVYRVLDDDDIQNLCDGKGIRSRAAHNRLQQIVKDQRIDAGHLYHHVLHGQSGADDSRFISTSFEKDWIMWYVHKKSHLQRSGKLKRSKNYSFYPIVEIDLSLLKHAKVIDISEPKTADSEKFGTSKKADMVRFFASDAKEIVLQEDIPVDAITAWFEVNPKLKDGLGKELFSDAFGPTSVSKQFMGEIEREEKKYGITPSTTRSYDKFESFRIWRAAFRKHSKLGNAGAMDALFEECKAFAEKIRGGKCTNTSSALYKIFNSEGFKSSLRSGCRKKTEGYNKRRHPVQVSPIVVLLLPL